jgi:hypothetical protein
VKKLILALLLATGCAYAQSPFSSVSVSATVTGLSGNSNSSPGTLIEGTVPVSSKLSLGTLVLLDSAINTNGYYGLVEYNLPLPKSVDSKKFQFFVSGALGVDQVTDQHISGGGFVGFNYDPTGSGHFAIGPRVGYLRLPGSASPNAAVVSLGTQITLGK